MTWTNPIDKLPQVPVDWANHIIYGGAAGVLLIAARVPSVDATYALLAAGAAKKLVDHFREGESWGMCVGKALVGALWPASVWGLAMLGR